MSRANFFCLASLLAFVLPATAADGKLNGAAEKWRADKRVIDLHQHIEYTTQRLDRAVKIMDGAGIGLGVNLSGGLVTRQGEQPSEFARNKELSDRTYPGRFIHYMNLDYKDWNEPDFSERAVKQVEEGYKLGAAGLKEYKRLGLTLRGADGKLIKIDDPKLDPMWKRCGELKLPISIHISDPKAFWLPYNESNERWKELKDHRSWWFGDTNIYPRREELHAARNRVIARHPGTTFVCLHFANNPEDIVTVGQWLDTYPNMMADLAARIPELGRHQPDKVRELFIKHQDRILFGTDFMVYDRLILGSGGSGSGPTDEDAASFYQKHWRWLETRDRDFAHMTPIQGDWTISAIGLPEAVLRKIYFDNARKLLARSLPTPKAQAKHVGQELNVDGKLDEAAWQQASPILMDRQSASGLARPEVATTVRALWSQHHLYLGYDCPFTRLTVFEPAQTRPERMGLWEKDVIEAFIAPHHESTRRYLEFEVAPSNERLDLVVELPARDFAWDSHFETAVHIDQQNQRWTAELKIPLSSLTTDAPTAGSRWLINLYRCDRANEAFLAWNPTLRGTFHTPDRFGVLEFVE